MSLTMYQASIPTFTRMLENLSKILEKAAVYAETRKIDPAVLVNGRLAPDMYPLSKQIQIATDMVKGCAARLAGVEVPKYEDNETSLADLKARIAKTVAFMHSVTPEQVNGSETRDITLTLRGKEIHYQGQPYLFDFVIPNFYFHITMTYAILRHNGLDIGKMDYLGRY